MLACQALVGAKSFKLPTRTTVASSQFTYTHDDLHARRAPTRTTVYTHYAHGGLFARRSHFATRLHARR